jgi:hypothetical protein
MNESLKTYMHLNPSKGLPESIALSIALRRSFTSFVNACNYKKNKHTTAVT